jgi:PilZ domain
MPEARRSERVKTLLSAQIIFNNRMSTISCVIKNISSTGAKLALADAMPVPHEFELYIPQKGRSYRARLVRRDSEGIGVEFHPADTDKSSEARLRELEAENAQLKARIRILSKRLADLGQDPNIAA